MTAGGRTTPAVVGGVGTRVIGPTPPPRRHRSPKNPATGAPVVTSQRRHQLPPPPPASRSSPRAVRKSPRAASPAAARRHQGQPADKAQRDVNLIGVERGAKMPNAQWLSSGSDRSRSPKGQRQQQQQQRQRSPHHGHSPHHRRQPSPRQRHSPQRRQRRKWTPSFICSTTDNTDFQRRHLRACNVACASRTWLYAHRGSKSPVIGDSSTSMTQSTRMLSLPFLSVPCRL